MNDRVPEGNRLILRMIILGIVIGILGSFIVEAPLNFIKGILFGTIFSILKLKLMEISIKKSIRMNEGIAPKYAMRGYMARYILTGVILLIAAMEPTISFFGTVFGILTMKAAAFITLFYDKRNSLKTVKTKNTRDMK